MGITVTYIHKKPDPLKEKAKYEKRIKKLKKRIDRLREKNAEQNIALKQYDSMELSKYELDLLDTIITRAEHQPLDPFTQGDLEEFKRRIVRNYLTLAKF